MEDKDEYINSLLLGLFLMQGEIDRLNETLDMARKGELVYINNPKIEIPKEESKEIVHYLACMTEQRNKANKLADKYRKTLQEIKEIADAMYEDYSKRWDDNISEGLEQIIDLITKAESEG